MAGIPRGGALTADDGVYVAGIPRGGPVTAGV